MQARLFSASVFTTFVLTICTASLAGQSPATEQILHSFTGGLDGVDPASGLTIDKSGNLYGSTFFGGSANAGTVFKISPNNGGWTETVLYSFKGGTTDGANPDGNLLVGPKGQVIGTTVSGGPSGYGVLFALIPSGTSYVEKLVHVFPKFTTPTSGVIADRLGNLYGESGGGALGFGAVYEMKRTTAGYKYVLLYSFAAGADGADPFGGVILDGAGNLYGTTASGGSTCVCGNVFELKKGTNGTYTETILYQFTGSSDGVNPESALTMDSSGNLFGTTVYGGDTSCASPYGCGEVFELQNTGGSWTKTTLHAFTDSPDGHGPIAGVTFDAHGNLFGTTINGGITGTGTLYELAPNTGGWNESVVYSFSNGTDGGFVQTPVTFDPNGNLYGTAGFGGTTGDGVVFEFAGLGARR